jgi:hypothetical protein
MKTMNNLFKIRSTNYLGFILLISIVLQGCAPVFSELQSARTVGKNRVEFTPSYSSVNFAADGERDKMQKHIGLQAAYGISDKVDIRVRYERAWEAEGSIKENGISIGAIGAKFSLIEDKIAFYLPIGRAFGEDTEDTWQMHPTFIFTMPVVAEKIDVTIAPKYLISFCEGCENLLAINLGLSLSDDLTRWAIRPEYGMLFNPGEEGHFNQFSIGVSYTFGQDRE